MGKGVDPNRTAKICRKCGIEKPLDQFHKAQARGLKSPLARQSMCKKCQHAILVEQRRDPTRRAKFKIYAWRHSIKSRYGLSEPQYLAILEKQNGGCAICGAKQAANSRQFRLHVDHCHKTNQIRGLLCGNCNNGIGRFNDNPSLLHAAGCYLENP